jgi:hypothetical protein
MEAYLKYIDSLHEHHYTETSAFLKRTRDDPTYTYPDEIYLRREFRNVKPDDVKLGDCVKIVGLDKKIIDCRVITTGDVYVIANTGLSWNIGWNSDVEAWYVKNSKPGMRVLYFTSSLK